MNLKKLILIVAVLVILIVLVLLLWPPSPLPEVDLTINNPGGFSGEVYVDGDLKIELKTDTKPDIIKIKKPAKNIGTETHEIKIITESGDEYTITKDVRYVHTAGPTVTLKALKVKNADNIECEATLIYDATNKDEAASQVFKLAGGEEKSFPMLESRTGTVEFTALEHKDCYESITKNFDLVGKDLDSVSGSPKFQNFDRSFSIKNPLQKTDTFTVKSGTQNIKELSLTGEKEQEVNVGSHYGKLEIYFPDRNISLFTNIGRYDKIGKLVNYEPLEKLISINNVKNLPGVKVKVNNQAEAMSLTSFNPYTITTAGTYTFEIYVPDTNYEPGKEERNIAQTSPHEQTIDYDPDRRFEAKIENPKKVEMTVEYNGTTEKKSGDWIKTFKQDEIPSVSVVISGNYFEDDPHTFPFSSKDGVSTYEFIPKWKKGQINVTSLLAGGNLKILNTAGNIELDKQTVTGDILSPALDQGHQYTIEISGSTIPDTTQTIFLDSELYHFHYGPGRLVKINLPFPDEITRNSQIWIDKVLQDIASNSIEARAGKHTLKIAFKIGDWDQAPFEEIINIPYNQEAWSPQLKLYNVNVTTNLDNEGGAKVYIDNKDTELLTPTTIPFLSDDLASIKCLKGVTQTFPLFKPSEKNNVHFRFPIPEAAVELAKANGFRTLYEANPNPNSADAINSLMEYRNSLDNAGNIDSEMPELWNAYLWFNLKWLKNDDKSLVEQARIQYYDPVQSGRYQLSDWDKFLNNGLMYAIYIKCAKFSENQQEQYYYLEDKLNLLDSALNSYYAINTKKDPLLNDEIMLSVLYGLFLTGSVLNSEPQQRDEYSEKFENLRDSYIPSPVNKNQFAKAYQWEINN
ncbi:MAG: hypothetical protein K9N06_02940 [Candidatus Cloacimonetes bacterium]|nr:hypothetical protein [Candidatus Cloacimonadota bacterium]